MEVAEECIRSWMASGNDAVFKGVASDISNHKISLLDVVKALGEYMTSEQDDIRMKGVEFLSSVLEQLIPSDINRQGVCVLVTFFCNKLEDTETVIPALKGLVSLVKSFPFGADEATNIVSALFSHIQMRTLVQSTRFLVFTILDVLIAKQRNALKEMGNNFLSGYVALAESEKDPRNLLLAFSIARVILIEFDITEKVEDFFDIIFCYFPITFRPPPNDPYGITHDELKIALRQCLNATRAFGAMAYPLFLEKLTAGSPVTKRDTLQTIALCIPVYGANVTRKFSREIWNSLKLEIFQPTDPDTEDEALKTLQNLIRIMYEEDTQTTLASGVKLQGPIIDICQECLQILREPEKSQAKAAISVLSAFVATTPQVSQYAICETVTHLARLFRTPEELPNQLPIITHLTNFMTAIQNSTLDATNSSILSLKDDVFAVFFPALTVSATRETSLRGLKTMVLTEGWVTDEEIGFVVHKVTELIQEDLDVWSRISTYPDLLSTIAGKAPRHLQEQTLPLLFSSLPNTPLPESAYDERAKCWRILSALSTLCLQQELFETLVIRLTTKIDLIYASSSIKRGGMAGEHIMSYAHALLTTIADTLLAKIDKRHPDTAKYIDSLVPHLYHLVIHAAISGHTVGADAKFIRSSARIINLIVGTVTIERQQRFAAALFSAFQTGNIDSITRDLQNVHSVPADCAFLPLRLDAPDAHRNTVFLLSAAVTAFRHEVEIPVSDLGVFLNKLIEWNHPKASVLQKEAAWHLIGSIVNKKAQVLDVFFSNRTSSFPIAVAALKGSKDERLHAISSWIWVAKALLIRDHPFAFRFVDGLFHLFNDDTVSWDAGQAIGELVHQDDVLTKRNHALIKILYAQKYFNKVLPTIIQEVKSSTDPKRQTAGLVALSFLIKFVPKKTFITQLSSLISLLIRGLELPDNSLRTDIINSLISAAEDSDMDKTQIAEYAPTLVLNMLRNCIVSEMPDVKVRTAALRYLSIIPKVVRYDILHPYKSTIIRELAKALDDPRRIVRQEAIEARQAHVIF